MYSTWISPLQYKQGHIPLSQNLLVDFYFKGSRYHLSLEALQGLALFLEVFLLSFRLHSHQAALAPGSLHLWVPLPRWSLHRYPCNSLHLLRCLFTGHLLTEAFLSVKQAFSVPFNRLKSSPLGCRLQESRGFVFWSIPAS